jgi:cobyrinic acid a,c-diamide synthase
MTARVIIVGAPRSGSGKTTITLGLLRAFRRRGLVVRAAKAGPDYIDPAFHAAATGTASVNLDSWAMPPEYLGALLQQAAEGADLLVIEAAMGLFDGVGDVAGRRGAAADIAARFGIKVALVLDVTGQGQTVGAVACGFVHYDPAVGIAGVIANRVASTRHRNLAERSVTGIGLPLLGALMRDGAPNLPERHLGLVQAREHANLEVLLESLADAIERDLDLDAILDAATPLRMIPSPAPVAALPPPGQRIALAWDEAFSFVYPHMLREWRDAGAEIARFSPLADEAPAHDCDICWLPGGYPELRAGRLASASHFLSGLRSFAQHRPVHGECGGFMVLGQSIEDAAGTAHEMVGLMDHRTSFARRKLNLGYREATLLIDCPLGPQGTVLRGHEFHYATITPGEDAPLAMLADGLGQPLGAAGGQRELVTGTFFHAIARQAG